MYFVNSGHNTLDKLTDTTVHVLAGTPFSKVCVRLVNSSSNTLIKTPSVTYIFLFNTQLKHDVDMYRPTGTLHYTYLS